MKTLEENKIKLFFRNIPILIAIPTVQKSCKNFFLVKTSSFGVTSIIIAFKLKQIHMRLYFELKLVEDINFFKMKSQCRSNKNAHPTILTHPRHSFWRQVGGKLRELKCDFFGDLVLSSCA